MKEVTFGEDKIIIIENISKYLSWPSSFIETLEVNCHILSEMREIHNEKPNLDLIYKTCKSIVNHVDVYHVDIYLKNNNKDKFTLSLFKLVKLAFNSYSKSCRLLIGNKNKMYFRDKYSNPSLSLDENFRIEEHWDE